MTYLVLLPILQYPYVFSSYTREAISSPSIWYSDILRILQLKLIPPSETTGTPNFVPNKSNEDEESKTKEPGEDPQILQPVSYSIQI